MPFPPTEAGDKWQISTEGGAQPTWRGDSRELYFLALDGSLMAVEIEASKTFTFGDPKRLFKLEFLPTMGTEQYAPHPGGQKFLIVKPSSDSAKQPFTVVLNWTSKLKK